MNKPRAFSERASKNPYVLHIGLFLNPRKKFIDTIIVDLDGFKLFVYIHDGQKIGINCSN